MNNFDSAINPPKKNKTTELSGNWDAFNKQQLEKLISDFGKGGKFYNREKPPYAIFDWDNTSIFLDIQEATLIYQLENLLLGYTPKILKKALQTEVEISAELADTNTEKQKITTAQVAEDIVESYTWIYNNYSPLSGNGSLAKDEIKAHPHYLNFRSKVRFLYDAIYNTFGAGVAYPWVTYLFAGLDLPKIAAMTVETVKWQLTQKIETVIWGSPSESELPGQLSGQVSVSWKNGLRLIPEMQQLYKELEKAGFDIWICSASFIDVIKGISTNPDFGYGINSSQIIAMELERNENGKLLPEFKKGYFQTQGEGKTKVIKKLLSGPAGKYGYDPVFIAGDSEGDQNMLADFNGLKAGLIFNRLNFKGKPLEKLVEDAIVDYGKSGAKYLLQGRDENSGTLIPEQGTIRLGEKSAQKIPK